MYSSQNQTLTPFEMGTPHSSNQKWFLLALELLGYGASHNTSEVMQFNASVGLDELRSAKEAIVDSQSTLRTCTRKGKDGHCQFDSPVESLLSLMPIEEAQASGSRPEAQKLRALLVEQILKPFTMCDGLIYLLVWVSGVISPTLLVDLPERLRRRPEVRSLAILDALWETKFTLPSALETARRQTGLLEARGALGPSPLTDDAFVPGESCGFAAQA